MVGLILVSVSPVLALAADEISQPENQTPTVEVVETNDVSPEPEEAVEEVVETEVVEEVTTEEPVVEVVEEVIPTLEEVGTPTDNVGVEEVVELEVTPEVVQAAKAMTNNSDNSFAISDEQGGTTASQPTNNSTLGENQFTTTPTDDDEGSFTTDGDDDTSTSTEHQFNTLPTGGCTSGCGGDDDETVSPENTFTTLPNGGCTSGCGGDDDDEVVSGENNFRTLSDSGCTSGCGGDDDEVVSGENSFNTLNNGGGCTENCGGDDDDVVSGENSFTTSNDGGGGSNGGGGNGGGGGGGSRNRDRDNDPLPAACEVYLKKFIRLGYANDPFEVTKLEVFLNAFEGFDLSVNGIYEQHDFEAVSIFQKRYLGAVLTPWAITDSTGYVYITTTLTINQIYCRHTVGNDLDLSNIYPVYNPATGEVEGFTSTSTSSTTPSIQDIPNFFEAAAVGALNFLKDWWCLLAIIILILIIAYLLDERERLAKKLEEAKHAGITEIIIPPHFEETDIEGTFIPGEEVDEDQKPLL